MRKRLGLALLLACSVASISSVNAAPAVEFTKVQDLNPNAAAKNTVVKQKWAVVIGLSKFRDRRMNSDAPNAHAARQFHAFLIDPKFGRFQPDHVKLLTDEDATLRNINSAFGPRWLGGVAGKDDLVVVYIASDAFPTTDGGTFLAAYDCALDNVYGTCMSLKDLMQSLRKTIPSERVVLVLQSNYSGAADLNSGAKSLMKSYNVDLSQILLGKGFVILTSSRPDQVSYGDSFTQNLIEALKQNDGLIPLQTAFQKAKERTEYDTTYKMHPARTQSPTMKSEWKGTDLVLGTPPLERIANVPENIETFQGAEAHYLKASKLAAEGNMQAAIAEYKAAIGADPTYADAIADYGVALGLSNDWSAAVGQLRRAVELEPNDVLFRTNLARALDQTGDTGECIKQLEYAYSVNPKDSTVIRALASKAIQARDFQSASKLLSEALALYPNSAPLHDRAAYVASLNGDAEDALKHANKAVQLDPQLISAQMNRGSILLAKGDLNEAMLCYKQIVTREPKNVDGWYLLSQAADKKGDMEATKQALQQFLTLCPQNDRRVEAAKERLSNLTPQN